MSQPKRRRRFRLNVRAASLLGIGLLVAVSGFLVLSYVRGQLGAARPADAGAAAGGRQAAEIRPGDDST